MVPSSRPPWASSAVTPCPPVFIQTVRGSNLVSLMGEGDSSIPVNLDQLYEEGNPEQGMRNLHHISMAIQPFMKGDSFYVAVGGGAGYGDPLERDPESVVGDLIKGRTSPWAARNMYEVAYDEETLRLDPEKTKSLRAEAVAERKKKGTALCRI